MSLLTQYVSQLVVNEKKIVESDKKKIDDSFAKTKYYN